MRHRHGIVSTFVALCLVGAGAVPAFAVTAADPISDGQWYVQAMQLDAVHKISKGKGIVVAVIDTGVDATHPDLAGSVKPGADTTIRGPGNGLTDLVGHGTGMAGLIVGHGRTRGVAPEATVVSVRAETGGSSSPTDVAAAIDWAVEHGAHVISVSLASNEGDAALERAVSNALRKNVAVVAGAGNTEKNTRVGFPASYRGVIAVGGVGKDGSYSSAAVAGNEVVIAAPCDKISTAFRNHEWAVGTGTSNSAALVAGAAAVLRAKFPNLSARDITHRLTVTAADKGPSGRDTQYGFGVVNLTAALTADVAPLPAESPAATGETPPPFTTGPPLAAPGAGFPVGMALVLGVILLVVLAIGVWLLVRRRR